MNESQDANMYWLQGYIDQSITFSSWRKVEYKASQILKQNVEKKLMDPVNRQIIFKILGPDFVNKYFSSYTNSPAVLDNIRPEEKTKKLAELRMYISSVIDGALQKTGSKSDSKLQSDVSSFSHELQNVVETNLDDEFSEMKSKKKPKQDLHERLLITVLNTDTNSAKYLIPELNQKQVVLSDSLRMIIWPVCISSKEKSKNIKNSEKIKEKFIQLYIKQRTSELDKDIESATNEIFKETKCLNTINSENNVKSTVSLLSICNSYGRKFQRHFIFPAIIVQQVYLKDSLKRSDEDYGNAASMLEKLLRLCSLTNDRVHKISSATIQILIDSDRNLENHIKKTLSEEANTSKDETASDVTFYLKKWISSMFTAVLKPYTLLCIWDQLFYNKFENKIFQDISLALLGLLKPWFLLAKNKDAVEKVFLEEPSFLYLLDIRKALAHVQKKADFQEVPSMNRNIRHGNFEPTKSPSPSPPSLVPNKTPIVTAKPKLPPKFIPWVPFNKEKKKEVTQVIGKVDMPFDLYIDSVRFIPDNATIVKVTGKVINMYLNSKDKFIKFQSYPEVDSYWRYPSLKFKQTINIERLPMNPDVVIMLRLYTVESHSKNTYVLGSCLFGPFSNKHGKEVKLRTGGHQLRIRHGVPDPDFDVEHMLASHMDNNPVIPGVTILLRVIPHSKEYVIPPHYETNCYRSELAKPNESENNLYNHYKISEDLSLSVKDATVLLTGQNTNSDVAVKQLAQQQFQKEGSDVEDFPYQRYIRYCKNKGMMVLVDKAAGLPLFLEGRYLQCLVQIFPGEDTKLGDGKSQVINFLTNDLELDSVQRAPDWSDQPKRVHPEYDDRAFVLVCLYGLRPRYDPAVGKLLDKDGRDPKFNLQQAIAWSAAPCFDKNAVYAGIHHVPLLKGRPPDDIIEKLSYLPLDFICKKFKNQVKVFEAASIEISIWDGHFSNSECPPLPVHSNLLNISKNPSKYMKAFENRTGPTAADLIKTGMPNPTEFSKYISKITILLNEAFKNNLDNSLSKSGFKGIV